MGVERAWRGKTEDGEARFGCPVCKAEEVKAEGEFWVEVATEVGLPGDDYVGKGEGEGEGMMRTFRWAGPAAGEEFANAQVAAGGGTWASLLPLVYTPSPAEIARRNRPGAPPLPTMVIPAVSRPAPTPASLVPESTSIRSTMGRSRSTTFFPPAPPLPEDSA